MGRFHVFPSGWWRCCAMYDTTRCSGAEGIHPHLLPIALFSNHLPCGLFPFVCFEWRCLWNWTYARYHFNQWMRLEEHHQFIHARIVRYIFLTLASNQIVVHNYICIVTSKCSTTFPSIAPHPWTACFCLRSQCFSTFPPGALCHRAAVLSGETPMFARFAALIFGVNRIARHAGVPWGFDGHDHRSLDDDRL